MSPNKEKAKGSPAKTKAKKQKKDKKEAVEKGVKGVKLAFVDRPSHKRTPEEADAAAVNSGPAITPVQPLGAGQQPTVKRLIT